ncbi:MAG TPA: CvpA family protein [Tepidisphaeraceae bacterium]|nr:CvpA family protein [Tepidisphaeraceae bacterium]
MIFSILILVLVGIIAFFHYTQGLFSAAISALLAIVSAAIALSYEEVIVNTWLQGKFADEANAIVLVVTFAVVYCVLRFIFDAAVPGNVRLPVLADKVGAGVFGVIAGIVTAGIIAIAAQMLPFGPVIAGYGRFETVASRHVILSEGMRQAQDMEIHDELKNGFDTDSQRKLILPVDDWVMNFVSYLSEPSGALAGERTVTSIHPDWLNELFADRLGVEVGGKRVAMNVGKNQQVKVTGVYAPASLPEIGGESKDIREQQPSGEVKSNSSQMLLVVRIMFDRDATDDDNLVRFSMANCRLIVDGKAYYGIGTVANGQTLLASNLDDPLFIPIKGADHGADVAFLVPPSDVLASNNKPAGPMKLSDNVLLQVKRLAWVDLSGKKVSSDISASPDVSLLRTPDVEKLIKPAQVGISAPLDYQKTEYNAIMFTSINVGTPDANVNDQQLTSGTISLHDKKFSKLDINPTETIQRLKQGGYPVNEFYAATGKSIIQVYCQPSGDNAWKWADVLDQFTLVDSDGHRHKPSGAVAKLIEANGQEKMVAEYNAESPITSFSSEQGTPTDIWLIYQVPAGTQAKQWDFKGKLVHTTPAQ